MATLQELSDMHEEILEICGNFVAMVRAIDGEEDPTICENMGQCADKAKQCILSVCGHIDELMELKREAE